MTDRRHGLGGGVLLGALALVLTGCSHDSGPLSKDQLPGKVVESETHTSGTPTATQCADLNQAQGHISDSSGSETGGKGSRYWTYRLADGTWIAVNVSQLGYPVTSQAEALDLVTQAIESCAGQVDELADAPDGTVGYRSTTTSSNGTRDGETLVAKAGDDRIVMVMTTHDQGTKASVDVADLLDDVQERAADVDLS